MKYIGSKSKIAKDIVPILQKLIDDNDIEIYIEPFVGGFNVIDKIKCKYRVGNDIDNIVIDLVEYCIENPTALDNIKMPTKEEYYHIRDNKGEYDNWFVAANLLFASYNARVYGGCYGAFAKTKDGGIRNYFEESKRNFLKQLPSLYGIALKNKDYRDLNMPNNCLIYCDPPYSTGIGYSGDFDNEEFWEWCRKQSSQGNIVVVSEYEAPDDFKCIWEKNVKTHQNNRNKLERTEKLFMYKK